MEELKTGPEEVKGKKINRPISSLGWGEESFLKREVLKNYSFFLGAFRKE